MKNQKTTLAAWAKMLSPALVAGTLLFSACTEEVTPELQAPNTELIAPSNVLTFESGEALAQAIGQLKDGSFDATNYFQGEGQFTPMYQIWMRANAEVDAVLAPFAGLAEADLNTAEVTAAMKALEGIEQKYQDQVIFEDHLPSRLKFNDELMAKLVNQDGLLIIGTRLFRYQNGSIQHAALSTERNAVADLLATAPSDLVETISLDADGMANRDDIVAQQGCGTSDASGHFDAFARVTNTFVPVTETRQEWVPPYCEEDLDCGPTEDCDLICYDGYYRTVTVVVGEQVTNTRVYAEIKTRQSICFIFCWTADQKANHVLSLTGTGLNEYSSGHRATTTITKDLTNPATHGNATMVAEATDRFGFYCNVTLWW